MRMIIKKGFTLIETIVFILVISIGLSGVMALLLGLIKDSAQPIITSQAASIGMLYMEEILGKSFYDPITGLVCSPVVDRRYNFNKVCDYQDQINNQSIYDINEAYFDAFSGYTATVTITYPAVFETIPGADVIQVEVSVHHSEIPDVVLVGYRTAY